MASGSRSCDDGKALTVLGKRKVIDAEIVSVNGVPVAKEQPEPSPRMRRRRRRPSDRRTFSQDDEAVERSRSSTVMPSEDSAARPSPKLDGKEFRGLAARGPGVFEKGPFDDLVERKATELAQQAVDVVRSFLGTKR